MTHTRLDRVVDSTWNRDQQVPGSTLTYCSVEYGPEHSLVVATIMLWWSNEWFNWFTPMRFIILFIQACFLVNILDAGL